ncbi:MAG: putative toxin-antitoxin system toxin component, PIN family [Nitrospirota bacterium]|nr:putative toxin-antitoxin system toxin component, PIN family [Nitrospirota bacterium]MDE3226257.1 putative toxin-antitoxin system toxin component, PIN family [Nitrospirota bacterium]
MKAVFDTNVYISALLIPGSKGEQAFLLARRRQIALYGSVPILTETAKVLRTKFNQSEQDVKAALKVISRAAQIVRPSQRVTVLADVPDNRILECAMAARTDMVVTGDQHLLALKVFEAVPIVRLADFLRMFPQEE